MSLCSDAKPIAASDNIDHAFHTFDRPPYKDDSIWLNPNRLSEEMVSCMRDIFLQFSSSSESLSSQIMSSAAALQSELSNCSSAVSISVTPLMECLENKLCGWENSKEDSGEGSMFDPYRVPVQMEWNRSIGTYGMAIEVSSLSVGKKELFYVAAALKRFRSNMQTVLYEPRALYISEPSTKDYFHFFF